VAFAAGTLVKWTPALAFVALLAWLVASRRGREGVRLVVAFGGALLAVYVPFLLWDADHVLAAYSRQSGRSITPESVWYLLLRPFDLARVRTHISFSAGAPDWADAGATVAQLVLVLAVVVVAARAHEVRAAVAAAALAPVVFLLTNRIFSPQFVLVAFAGWAIAAALVVRTRREQLWVGVAMGAAAVGNQFVYPFALPEYDRTWVLSSVLLFGVGLALTAWLALRAASERRV
jgi:uncharacterized membrane protein